jgi:hypothetical protein
LQDELQHHEDGQHEHQNQQQAGHGIYETRPDGRLEPRACSAAQRHD